MANVSRVNGFRPVKHLTGAPYNGQANMYEVVVGDAIPVYIGDLVILGTGASTSGFPVATNVATATTAVLYAAAPVVGAVVGIVNTKLDPDGKLSTGSMSLDIPIYRAASTKQFVLVADAPDLVFEAEKADSTALADIGMMFDIAQGAMTAAGGNGTSSQGIATTAGTTVATRPLQVIGVSKRVDNESAAAYNKMLVRINTHQYGSVGTVGV